MCSWLMSIALSTSAPPTTSVVPVVGKVSKVGGWDEIPLTDTPAASICFYHGLNRLSLGGGASGFSSMGLSSIKSIF